MRDFKNNNRKQEYSRKDSFKKANIKHTNNKQTTKSSYKERPHIKNEVIENVEQREDIIEGRNPVFEALKTGREIDKIFISNGEKVGSILQVIGMARDKGIIIHEVDRRKLDSLSQTGNHQGIIAYAAEYKYVEVIDILNIAKARNEAPFIVILDEITDPHNLGSILRSCNAAGVHGVIIPKRRSVGISSIVSKVAAGAAEYVPVAKVTNINQTIEYLKEQGIWIVGTDSEAKEVHYKSNLKGAIALVIGSEGEGIGRLIKENCDFLVKIPMKGEISSLNAGVAAGILMFEVIRQREW